MSERSPSVIIGVGNAMRRDDGVGPAAVAALAQYAGRDFAERTDILSLDGEPTRLLDSWRGRRSAMVIDAACAGAVAGSIHRVDVGVDPLPPWAAATSSHGAGLAEAIALATALDALPERLIVFGIEPADVSFGEGLSTEVEAALPALIDQVISETRR